MRRKLIIASTPVALAIALSASVAPAQGAALQFESFSESQTWQPPGQEALQSLKRQQCASKPAPDKLSFGAGLERARKALTHMASPRALAKLAKDRDIRNPRKARGLAAAALVANRPNAALAALLDSERMAPHDPMTLVDLSAVLIQLEMPSEALAVLKGVGHVGREPTPMGIGLKEVMDNDRGLALLRLGHDREAQKLLTKAQQHAPFLLEARENAAVAQLCGGGGGTPKFPPPWREPPDEPPVKNSSTGGETQTASSSFDMSQGVTGTLPYIPYPDSYEQTAATREAYEVLQRQYYERVEADAAESAQLSEQYNSARHSHLTDERTAQIIQLIEDENEWPQELQSLALAANDPPPGITARGVPDEFQEDLAKASEECSDETCYRARCQAAAGARNEEWRVGMVSYDNTERAFFAAYYRYATALAANLSDPASHAQALAQAHSVGDAIVGAPFGLASTALLWSETLSNTDCLMPPSEPEATGAGSLPGSNPCTDALKMVKASIKLSIFKFSVNCEKFESETEISTPGPISLFGEVSHNHKCGSTTVFAGGKVGGSLAGLGASAKTGLYVRVGSDGGVQDVGWRFSPEAEAAAGGAVMSASDSMDFSFADAATGC